MIKKINVVLENMWNKKLIIFIALMITIVGSCYSTNFVSFHKKFTLLIFLIGLIAILFIGKTALEWTCFVIIMGFGSFFVIFSPVFDVLDEPAHYARAEHIAEGNFFLHNEDDTLAFSKDYQYLTDLTGYNGMNRLDPKVNFFHSKLFSKKHDTNKQIETKIKATRTYGSIVYLPGAFGLWLGKLISNGNLGVMFYLGRFLNLLMYAVMAFFAIRMAGRWKLIVGFFSIQHLPIYISASFSQDAFFYGLSLLIFAKFIQLFDKKDLISYRDVVEITILTGLMAYTKLPYIMLIGLMLFIPIKRYQSKKVYAANFIGIGLVIVTSLIWLKYYSGMVATDLPKSVDQKAQLSFMIDNPELFAVSLSNGVLSTVLKLKQYFTFGWSYHYSELAYILYLPVLGMVIFMFPVQLRNKVNNWFKVALIGVSLGIIMLTNIILYLTFTGVGEKNINGVQGRYFYGLLVLVPFLTNLSSKVFFTNSDGEISSGFKEKEFTRIILAISIIFLIWMSTMRIGAYY